MSGVTQPLNFAQTKTALDLIVREGAMRTVDVAQALELSEGRVRKALNGLVDEGLLEVVMRGNSRYFRKPVPKAPEEPYVGHIAAPRFPPKFRPLSGPTLEQLARFGPDGKARRIGA
jgi:predicted transcriptional regulator of viral defense system